MTLYLAKIKLRVTRYMQDRDEDREEIRIVEANDTGDAYLKVKKYYEDKSDTYGTSYHVNDWDLNEAIT